MRVLQCGITQATEAKMQYTKSPIPPALRKKREAWPHLPEPFFHPSIRSIHPCIQSASQPANYPFIQLSIHLTNVLSIYYVSTLSWKYSEENVGMDPTLTNKCVLRS